MKYLVISDIHGSALCLETALKTFEKKADLIILCGDYLNHGPRNPLPEGWDTKKTAALLNEYKNKIVCVRGNCDSEVDQMMLTFPCLNAYTTIFTDNGRRIFVHHGHLYTHDGLCGILPPETLVVSGHTHVTLMEEENKIAYFNPGSVSLPKCTDGKTCGILETLADKKILAQIYSIDGKLIREKIF